MTVIWFMASQIWSTTNVLWFWTAWPFTPLKTQKIKIKKKMKKTPGDIIILHKCAINDNRMSDRQNFLSFWTPFSSFIPLTTQEIKILKNWKKTTGDIIILHKCTKNHDHMLHCSLDMTCNRFNCYFSFRAIFCPFTYLTAWKIKILKNMKKKKKEKKKPGDILSLYNMVPKIYCYTVYSYSYTVAGIWCMTDVIIFCSFTKKSKFKKKNEKNAWRYHSFTYASQKLWSDDARFLRYGAWQMEKVTYWGGCHT